jgi:CBS domain-containing protein
MRTMARRVSTSQIYAGDGRGMTTSSKDFPEPALPPRVPTIANRVPITAIMTSTVVCARSDVSVEVLAHLMTEHRVGCVPIVDESGVPLGMVTRFDLVDDMDRSVRAHGIHRMGRTGKDVMMPLTFHLDERATIAQAATLMTLEDVHHVMVVCSGGVLVGVVSAKDIVRWLVQNDGIAPS